MTIQFHSHALERIIERGTTQSEAVAAMKEGERFEAKFGRTGFRRNFVFDGFWRGKHYKIKQVEVFAVQERNDWLVISVITKFF